MTQSKRGFVSFLPVMLLSLLILLVTGCTGETQQPQQQGPYVGGTQGLEFAFQQDEPPTAVLDDNQQQFFITLLLQNRGEYTIPVNGVVASLSGVDRNAFGLGSLTMKNDLEIQGVTKDQEFVIQGAEEILEFGEAMYVNDVPADFDLTLRSDICYSYKTEAVTNLCLKQNVLEKTIEDVCEVNVPSVPVHSSGAPVQVTQLRQSTVGSSKVKLVFTVANQGQGIVYLPGTFSESCSGKETNRDKLTVTLSNPQRNFNVVCSTLGGDNSGEIRLVNGRKEVSCTIDTGGLQSVTFQDLLLFELNYVYREAVTTPLRVENAV